MRKLWLCLLLGFAVAMAVANGAQARNLDYSDILGTWCGNVSQYVFTRQSLTVTWYGKSGSRVLLVKEYVFGKTMINVKWEPRDSTVFGEFSKDGRTMVQQPNIRGDMGPRRVFHRCK